MPSTPKKNKSKKKTPTTPKKRQKVLTIKIPVNDNKKHIQKDALKVYSKDKINTLLHNNDIFFKIKNDIANFEVDKIYTAKNFSATKITPKLYRMKCQSDTSFELNTEVTVNMPEPDFEGKLYFQTETPKRKYYYVLTKNGIKVFTCKKEYAPKIEVGNCYKIFFVDFRSNTTPPQMYLRDDSLILAVDNARTRFLPVYLDEFRHIEPNTAHLIKGVLKEAKVFSRKSKYTNGQVKWGVFRVQLTNEDFIRELTIGESAFEFFEDIEFDDFQDDEAVKARLNEVINSDEVERQMLINCYIPEGKEDLYVKVLQINDI